MVQGESDWNAQKLAQIFGQDKADAIMRLVQNERRLAETENLAVNGPETAAVTAAQGDLEQKTIKPSAVRAALNWQLGDAGAAILDKVTAGATQRRRVDREKQIVDAIMGRGDWRPTAAKPFFSQNQRNALSAAQLAQMMDAISGAGRSAQGQ